MVFYTDGRTYSSDDGPAEKAPTDGVQAVVEKRSDGTPNVLTGDFYFWNGENWVAGYQADLERWLRTALPALKFGLWTRDSTFAAVMEEANRWP